MATRTMAGTTNAVEMLKADHEKVKSLFAEFFESGERAIKKRAKLAEQIFHELEIHSKLEEEIFYPAFKQAEQGDEEAQDVVAESFEEHHVVDLLIAELKAMTPEEENYQAKMTVLCENVQHHIEEEEKEMLRPAKQALRGELETLGEQMLRRKQELLSMQ